MKDTSSFVATEFPCTPGANNTRPSEEGQGLVEWALILAFVAILVIVGLKSLQPAINGMLNRTTANLTTFARVDLVKTGVGPLAKCYPATTTVYLAVGGTMQWGVAGTCVGAGALDITDSAGNLVAKTLRDINTGNGPFSYVFVSPGIYHFDLENNSSVVGTVNVE